MDSRTVGMLSAALMAAGIVALVVGLYILATASGGSGNSTLGICVFAIGVVAAIAGTVLSNLHLRGFFGDMPEGGREGGR